MISDSPDYESMYAWIHLPGASIPVLCGRITREFLPTGEPKGTFVYGRSYLATENALPIDPVLLPLRPVEVVTTQMSGHFSAILDAGPDSWGRREIDKANGTQTDLGYLLHGAGDQVGALSFTRDVNPAPDSFEGFPETTLDELLQTAECIEQGLEVPERLQRLLNIGTGAGGARPKATILSESKQWLAKFPSTKDSLDLPSNPRLEAATLDLAAIAGLRVPDRRLVQVGGKDVLLVERFDRIRLESGEWGRHRYASARTIFFSRPDIQRYSLAGSYQRLARELSTWSASVSEDRLELFKRVVFNCLVSNTDEHDLNHGVLDAGKGFQLSPLFDGVPTITNTKRRLLAINAGDYGAEASKENLLSDCEPFGLTRSAAGAVIDSMASTVAANWERCLANRGVSTEHTAALAKYFNPASFSMPHVEPSDRLKYSF